jgi:hypothetical protein
MLSAATWSTDTLFLKLGGCPDAARGKKRPLGMMPAIDPGMRGARYDRELRAKILEQLQVLRGLVVAAGLLRG